MFPVAATPVAPVIAPFGRPPDQPSAYCPVPQRLITDLHDNPLAIGVYGLIGRLYLVAQSPIPLSVPDIMRYDPSLSRGAVLRALARLLAGGYITEVEQPGRKTRYTPAWGRINGTPLPWNMAQPCLSRPRHVARLRLDRRLLDICMGKLVPHPTRAAVITRYVTAPVLSLGDVGCYALTLAGVARETPALLRLGAVHGGMARALPSDQQLLALISQRALDLDAQEASTTELTLSGTRKLGITPLLAPDRQTAKLQPLFFVPPQMIGSLIDPLIGSMIGSKLHQHQGMIAAGRDENQPVNNAQPITWESRDSGNVAIPPPTPPYDTDGGGGAEVSLKAMPRRQRPESQILPDTESAAALQAINVKPTQIAELAHLPLATIEIAIADGRARPGVRDLAGWVVSLLRAHRDYGWRITPPTPGPNSPEALRDAFAYYAAEQQTELHASALDIEQIPEMLPPDSPAVSSDIQKLWNTVLANVQVQLSRTEFNTWIRRCILLSLEGEMAIISAPSKTVKAGLERRYMGMLRDAIAMHVGSAIRLRIAICEQDANGVMGDALQELPMLHPEPAPVIALSAASIEPTAQSAAGTRPEWITADRWQSLPAMLRAALLGARLVDGTVQTRSPHVDRLIATRYACEIRMLIQAATSLPSAASSIMELMSGHIAGVGSLMEPMFD